MALQNLYKAKKDDNSKMKLNLGYSVNIEKVQFDGISLS